MTQEAKATKTRLYIVTNHKTGVVSLVSGYSKWQAVEFVAREDYSCEVCNMVEFAKLHEQGIKVQEAVK